jgi:hypothetical protein
MLIWDRLTHPVCFSLVAKYTMPTSYPEGILFIDHRQRRAKPEPSTLPKAYPKGIVFVDDRCRQSERDANLTLSTIRTHAARTSFYTPRRRVCQLCDGRLEMGTVHRCEPVTQQALVIPPRGRWEPFDCFAVKQPPRAAQQVLHWGKAVPLVALG